MFDPNSIFNRPKSSTVSENLASRREGHVVLVVGLSAFVERLSSPSPSRRRHLIGTQRLRFDHVPLRLRCAKLIWGRWRGNTSFNRLNQPRLSR